MNCFLFKLQFETPVHFGASDSALSLYSSEQKFCADTLFSALCHTALSLYGADGVEQLCDWAKSGKLLLSDAMPWKGQELYLPKPCVTTEINTQETDAKICKQIKKTHWIPIKAFDKFVNSIAGKECYNPREYATDFGRAFEVVRANVPDGEEDTRPYAVGAFVFSEGNGLYVLVQCTEDVQKRICELMNCLGKSGVGGKVSTGYGRFSVECIELNQQTQEPQYAWLYQAMHRTAKGYLLLTSSLPADGELNRVMKDARFQLIRRAGFVQSAAYSDTPQKKATQYFLAAGAVLRCRFAGELYHVGNGKHPVYRYSRPILLGVEL